MHRLKACATLDCNVAQAFSLCFRLGNSP
jgi:hypothetical protein